MRKNQRNILRALFIGALSLIPVIALAMSSTNSSPGSSSLNAKHEHGSQSRTGLRSSGVGLDVAIPGAEGSVAVDSRAPVSAQVQTKNDWNTGASVNNSREASVSKSGVYVQYYQGPRHYRRSNYWGYYRSGRPYRYGYYYYKPYYYEDAPYYSYYQYYNYNRGW
jgi:hypothetical protein